MQIYNTNLINKFYLLLKIIAVFKMHQYNLSDQVISRTAVIILLALENRSTRKEYEGKQKEK